MSTALLTASLTRFYRRSEHADVLESIVTGKSEVSLRLVEWYVSHRRDISMDYHLQLKAYTRRLFDPFRRSERVVLCYRDRSFETTLGQMNFFKWLIEEGHWARVSADKDALNAVMMEQVKSRKATQKSPPPAPPEVCAASDDGPAAPRPKTVAFD
jgi:hypothetical protein